MASIDSCQRARLQNYGYAIFDASHSIRSSELHVRDDIHEPPRLCVRQDFCSAPVFNLHVHGSLGAFFCETRYQRGSYTRDLGVGPSKAVGREPGSSGIWTCLEHCHDVFDHQTYSKGTHEGKSTPELRNFFAHALYLIPELAFFALRYSRSSTSKRRKSPTRKDQVQRQTARTTMM